MSDPLCLEFGKTYINGRKEIIRITGMTSDPDYPFMGDDFLTYSETGALMGRPTSHDILREAK